MRRIRKIYININSRCNCRCINCILKEDLREDVNVLSVKDIESLIETVKETFDDQVQNIVEISGGEPTLHPSFMDIVKTLHAAKEEGLFYKISLLSNAMTSSDMSFCSALSQYIDDVVVTLYDTDPDTHDSFTRVPGSFAKKVKAIDNFLSLGVRVHIKILVIKPSFQHLPQMADFIVNKWGKRVHVAINGTHYTGDAYKNQSELSLHYSDAVDYVERALDVLNGAGVTTSVFFPLCLLDPVYWKSAPYGFKEIIEKSLSVSPTYGLGKATRLLDEFINRSDLCKDCVLLPRCSWPWKRYCEINGDSEIAAAKKALYSKLV